MTNQKNNRLELFNLKVLKFRFVIVIEVTVQWEVSVFFDKCDAFFLYQHHSVDIWLCFGSGGFYSVQDAFFGFFLLFPWNLKTNRTICFAEGNQKNTKKICTFCVEKSGGSFCIEKVRFPVIKTFLNVPCAVNRKTCLKLQKNSKIPWHFLKMTLKNGSLFARE